MAESESPVSDALPCAQTAAATAAPALRQIADLPGPRGLPLLGNALQLKPARMHQVVEAWCRQHGRLFRFRIGRLDFVVVADHALVTEMLRDRPDGWRRSPQLQAVGQELGLTPGVFGSEGEVWRRQRRMVMGGLDPGRVRAYFPHLQRVTDRLHKRWLAAASAGRALALQPELMRFTVDSVAGLAFGADVNTLQSDGEVIQQDLDRLFPGLYRRVMSPLPYWRWLRLPAERALERSVANVKLAIAGFIAEARERLAADPARRAQPPNLLEAMIVAASDADSGISDEQVAANVLTMLLAGEDTTANTLAWLLHLLHRQPQLLQRASDEVRRQVPDPAAMTPEQLASLDFVEACIHETMRLKPVAPFMVNQALRDTRIADVHIPRGTMLWAVLRHDSVDAQHFGEPQRFDPARWLDGDAVTRGKRISMPFGAGPRACPGRYLALVEMKMLLAMLLGRFDITEVSVPGGGEAAERMSFTMVPEGLRMRLAVRD